MSAAKQASFALPRPPSCALALLVDEFVSQTRDTDFPCPHFEETRLNHADPKMLNDCIRIGHSQLKINYFTGNERRFQGGLIFEAHRLL